MKEMGTYLHSITTLIEIQTVPDGIHSRKGIFCRLHCCLCIAC